ncbi:MAG: preprotein translocase subunit SecG [Candidatus Bruticola sp.]
MYLDVCLSIWSFLGQAAAGGAAASAPNAAAVTAPAVMKLSAIQYILMFLYLLVCICLTGVVMQREQKQGGLQGMLGGGTAVEHNKYQGKKSFEEQLKTVSNYLAVAFIVLSILVSYALQHK